MALETQMARIGRQTCKPRLAPENSWEPAAVCSLQFAVLQDTDSDQYVC